ncbi:unnamed protein product [Diatraea saccharalis]|uniref:Uncharacterized protein n=1 Tax=Diatraea saccharalis TaxID=40085 RepID=A0A9N9QVD7_9NEOP|nr:unnamed protein product [Diatraea saccharalis]
MDCNENQNDNIRKIEDIIEIQRAKGNFNVRQVAFDLPWETDSTVSTSLTKSLESGLSKEKCKTGHKNIKKMRSKRLKCPLPDVVSWPSDSDITVLRMKLDQTNRELKNKVRTVVPGDGSHQPDSSSMVNLATLILQSQSPSKHSLNVEEYLLPLTSWEHCQDHVEKLPDEERQLETLPVILDSDKTNLNKSLRIQEDYNVYMSSRDSDYSKNTRKSKMARFLRLYFCPCCTCLYRLEKMQDEPSLPCFTNQKESINVF